MEDERFRRYGPTVTDVTVVCEGQTEQMFVNEVVAPAMMMQDVMVQPRLIATSRRAKGGALNRQRVFRVLRNILRQRQDTFVTTFFDLYRLPPDFPGHVTTPPDPLVRASKIEATFREEVVRAVRCRRERFLPHIQPYEFEALLFSDTSQFVREEPGWLEEVGNLEAARSGASSPEHINDGERTHPSARLGELPGYRKVQHGSAIARRIGLERIREECRHFGDWLSRIENLRTLA